MRAKLRIMAPRGRAWAVNDMLRGFSTALMGEVHGGKHMYKVTTEQGQREYRSVGLMANPVWFMRHLDVTGAWTWEVTTSVMPKQVEWDEDDVVHSRTLLYGEALAYKRASSLQIVPRGYFSGAAFWHMATGQVPSESVKDGYCSCTATLRSSSGIEWSVWSPYLLHPQILLANAGAKECSIVVRGRSIPHGGTWMLLCESCGHRQAQVVPCEECGGQKWGLTTFNNCVTV